MGKWLAFLFIMTGLSLAGQEITDDFSDGDFSNNPSWKGDSAFFIINASFQLQLKGNGPGVSSLVIPSPFSKLRNNEWRFWIRENFSPSANNFGRVYLVSDKDSLKDSLNGYYLQFGEAGSNDAVELFRQSGLQSQSVCRGLAGRIASAFSLGVKVTRDSTGFWTVYVDPAGGSNYRREASGLDTLITVDAFFGLMSSYTTSDETKFYWDDFAVRVVLADHSPPQLSALDVISPVSLDLQFDQAMDSITTGTVLNYWVVPDLGNPVIALADSQTQGLIHLHFLHPIQKNRTYTMHVSGLKDKNGIQMQPQLKTFGIFIPGSFDVVINEIMAKPTPAVNLPDCEYIELYNRQNFPVNLEGWTLSTGKNSHKLSGIQIQPDSFVVLCSASSAIQFGTDLPVYGVVGFPALNNTGEELSLENDSGRIISEVNYSDTWFRNPDKKGGGWSLEQIDPSNPCGGVSNWIDSQNSNGGTPGKRNSVFTANADHSPPELVRAYVLSVDSICLVFNEPLDTSSVLLPADYQMDNGINVQSVFPVKKEYRNVVLSLNSPLQKGIRYTITVQSRISDCVGNQILPRSSARLAIPDSACYRDVIINEILSDPNPGGVKYLELYNRSDKTIDLKDLFLCSEDSITGTITGKKPISPVEGYLFFPGNYILLSANSQVVMEQYYSPHPENFLTMTSMPKMNINSGQITLTTKDEKQIDRLAYLASWQFPLLRSTKGVSLERVNSDAPSDLENNWHSAAESVGFGTPGYRNSQTEKSDNKVEGISLANELFSPDDDGYQDVLAIDYRFEVPDYIGTITIYDARGRLTRNLLKNSLLGRDGSFYWDGLTEQKEMAPVGIYIVCFEVFDTSGQVKMYRKSCVLAAKL